MSIVYPSAIDSFSVPGAPSSTTLSSAGSSTRNHTQSHADLGAAIVALETNAAPLAHDHSTTDGGGTWPTNQLKQVNTHQNPDTDVNVTSLHHTLGSSPTQAAPGNHAHDYNGPSIFNQPLTICTSLSRPLAPQVGQMIWETDTNCVRAWASFPNNTLGTGLSYTYTFNSANSATSLDNNIFAVSYPVGASPADGAIGAPSSGNCTWNAGANVTCRAFARGVTSGFNQFATDLQQISFTTGTTAMSTVPGGYSSPVNAAYLRVSTDGTHYVRYAVSNTGVNIYYTTSGVSGETFLGGATVITSNSKTTWLCKANGNTYLIYANGQLVCSVVDSANAVSVGASYRGWAIGMTATAGPTVQLVPHNVTSVTVADLPYYTSPLTWQLLPIANKPHILAEARFRQQVFPLNYTILGFDTLLGNWLPDPFMNIATSETDITIQEAGVYQVNASLAWDPGSNLMDNAGIGFTLNGQDIGRLAKDFLRGNGFAPGFAQTQSCAFTYSFAAGDVLRVTAQHNANQVQWLFYNSVGPLTQVCWVELVFLGPPSS